VLPPPIPQPPTPPHLPPMAPPPPLTPPPPMPPVGAGARREGGELVERRHDVDG
jgi:hypothetical protein